MLIAVGRPLSEEDRSLIALRDCRKKAGCLELEIYLHASVVSAIVEVDLTEVQGRCVFIAGLDSDSGAAPIAGLLLQVLLDGQVVFEPVQANRRVALDHRTGEEVSHSLAQGFRGGERRYHRRHEDS